MLQTIGFSTSFPKCRKLRSTSTTLFSRFISPNDLFLHPHSRPSVGKTRPNIMRSTQYLGGNFRDLWSVGEGWFDFRAKLFLGAKHWKYVCDSKESGPSRRFLYILFSVIFLTVKFYDSSFPGSKMIAKNFGRVTQHPKCIHLFCLDGCGGGAFIFRTRINIYAFC